MFYKRHY